MKQITKAQIKIIHVLKNNLTIDDDAYREGLYAAFKVRSCKHLNFEQAKSLITQMKILSGEGNLSRETLHIPSGRKEMATVEQLDYVLGLWERVSQYNDRAKRKRALRAFIERIVKVSDMRFLTKCSAAKVINALKSMQKRKTDRISTNG